ncbi:hypothetical protein [Sulfuriflexus mobilis]|uniref:hypothetical protein n=1 Tax=Sulfuriflexus mobilis TaxID=1811807 RepID=UPI000F840D3E|nr:hypothetical protein [Sulfuriflexus mobilis]
MFNLPRTWLAAALLPGLLGPLSPLQAGEIITAKVEHQEKRYFMEIEALIDADSIIVKRLLTDYNHLQRLNDIIKQSYIIYSLDDVSHRVYVKTKACITFFCKSIVQVQDIEELPGDVIVATTVPEKSDFDYAHARWKIRAEGDRTRIYFNTDLKPSFWIPPLIGPPLIEGKLRKEALRTIEGLERLAGKS